MQVGCDKNSFLRFSRKVTILDYMLLHNSYINVAIAVILLGRKSLYDLQGLREDFSACAISARNGKSRLAYGEILI